MSDLSNEAAWLTEAGAPLKVDVAPMPTPAADELVIKVGAVAINPMEANISKTGMMLQDYPAILGSDGAGEVIAVGSDVQNFTPGDRVLACFDGIPPFPKADYRRNCYQRYAVSKAKLSAKIPDSVPYTDACVLPLCISSSADGLFSTERGMGLSRPKLQADPKPNGQSILIWGGSSSIGACSIQMLVLAGYEVGAVASAKNLDMCRSIGVQKVFDYNSSSVVDDIVKAYDGANFAGVFSAIMSKEAMEKVIEVYVKLGSKGQVGSIMVPGMPVSCEVPEGVEVRRGMSLLPQLVPREISYTDKSQLMEALCATVSWVASSGLNGSPLYWLAASSSMFRSRLYMERDSVRSRVRLIVILRESLPRRLLWKWPR